MRHNFYDLSLREFVMCISWDLVSHTMLHPQETRNGRNDQPDDAEMFQAAIGWHCTKKRHGDDLLISGGWIIGKGSPRLFFPLSDQGSIACTFVGRPGDASDSKSSKSLRLPSTIAVPAGTARSGSHRSKELWPTMFPVDSVDRLEGKDSVAAGWRA